MSIHDELNTRMKENYENRSKTYLTRRTPVIIRIDGRAFHTFTKGFKKPFDHILMKSMQETMKYLCENIQGCVFGYTQSDEISLVLIDYQTLTTDAWFDYSVQKMCSISASMATMAFNRIFTENVDEFSMNTNNLVPARTNEDVESNENYCKYITTLQNAINKGAMFDARCFNIPVEEVSNYIYARQVDATRNSIQMVGQAYFSQSQLQGKSVSAIQNMLFTEKKVNWNNFTVPEKRGTSCYKKLTQNPNVDAKDGYYPRMKWFIDEDMPVVKGYFGRAHVEKHVYIVT